MLCPTNPAAERWLSTLSHADIPAIALTAYDGRTIDAVKVGTYQRAKGLEFAEVFIPDHTREPAPRRDTESTDAHDERAALERRQLFVAMTRARDQLWLALLVDQGVGAFHNGQFTQHDGTYSLINERMTVRAGAGRE